MGGKTSTTTQQVQIPPEVLARYNAVNARAETAASKPFQIYSTDPADFVAQLNQQQLTGIGNVNAAAGSFQPYVGEATEATRAGMGAVNPADLDVGRYMNPFQQDVINATMNRMRQEQEQAQSGALGTAISSGAFGGDRAGIAAANLARQQSMATGEALANLNMQNYMQALQTAQQQQGVGLGAEQANLARLLAGGQQMAGLGQAQQAMGLQGAEAQINAGTLGQQTEQAGLGALYNQFMQQQAYPFQVAQFLANVAMGTGALSGSTTQTVQPAPFFSDRRLKHDIKRIGKTDDGLPIYSFKYKGDDTEQTHVGFMADEVEKVKPDAVGLDPSGYKTVDYDRATKADGGGVAGPYGMPVGSQPGVGSYVPQAYLPVSELMVADASGLENARMSLAQQLEAAANLGENFKELEGTWKWAKDKWGGEGRHEGLGAAERARGVKYANGGPAYLEGGVKPAYNPVDKASYLSDTISSQEEAKKNQIMQPGGMPDRPESGLKQLGDAASAIASIFALSDRRAKQDIRRIGKTDDGMPIYKFKYKGDDREQTHIGFMADEVERKHPDAVTTGPDGMKRVDYGQADKFYQGGLVRPGYAVGGGPEEEEEIIRRRLLSRDVPKAVTLGDLPDARALPAVEAFPTPPREAMPAGDLAGLAAAAIERADVKPVVTGQTPTGGLKPVSSTPMTDTGNAPAGGYTPIVPLKTQLDFVMHELAMPEYNSFLRAEYETPEQAAIGFEKIYERANGAGNDRAAAYARDIYSAVSSGDTSRLPPNAVAAFEHFTENGMDPIKAAGATGRLMVESYAHMDPNARNTIGGGYGTYGVAQWRGPRMEALADFAGVPMDAITSAPVSTPEGRYYSTGDGLGAANMSTSSASDATPAGVAGGMLTSDKPYAERTAVGKMFYNPDGTVNRNALLSLASGAGSMLASPSQFLLPSIGLGLQGAASTYAGLEKQAADIRGLDAQALQTTMQTAKESIFPVDGVNMIMTQSGLVPFWEFLDNHRLSTGERMVDDMLRRVGISAQGSGLDLNAPDLAETISVPQPGAEKPAKAEVPGNVIWTDASREALARDAELMKSQPGEWFKMVAQTSQILPAVNADRSSSISGKPNINELAYTIGSAINEGNMGSFGELYADKIFKPLKSFLPADWTESWASPETQSALLKKLSTLSATDMTPEQQTAASVFQQVAAIYPDLNMPSEAAAAITASIMFSNQEAIDRANYYNFYLSQQPTGRGSLVGADAPFAEEYSQLHQMEKANLQSLLDMADDRTPVGRSGKTKGDFVKEFLSDIHSGRMSAEEAQQVLTAILGEGNVSPGLYRYFIKGM